MANSDQDANITGEYEALKKAAEHFFLNSNDGDFFLVSAQQCLERNSSSELFEILREQKYKQLLDYVGWELVKIIFQFLPEDNNEYNDFFKILYFISEKCNPREICLSFVEILVYHLPWQKCITLIRLLQTTCKRLDGKVAKIFSSIFTSLTRYIRNRENKFEHLPEILEITLEFLRPHIELARDCILGTASEDIKELVSELRCFLVCLLEFPFAEVDISGLTKTSENLRKKSSGAHDITKVSKDLTKVSNDFENASEKLSKPAEDLKKTSENLTVTNEIVAANSKFVTLVQTIVEYLGRIEGNCFKSLLDYGFNQNKVKGLSELENDDEESSILSYVGLGCLAYLAFVGNIGAGFIPVVLTGRYSLEMTATYINTMLCSDSTQVINKGLQLLLAVLHLIEPETLDHSFTVEDDLFKLTGFLIRLMTHCEDGDIRKQAVQSLRELLNRFKARGKYKLLRLLNISCHHSGVAEFLILLFKEEITKCLQHNENEWFTGEKVASFLKIIFSLPPKVFQSEHGIVEERNRILSTLNLFRYLLIRDKENRTKIHNLTTEVEKSYIKPLMDTISLSKAKLKEYVKEKKDQIAGKVPVPKVEEELFSVSTPGGCELEQSSLQEQLDVLQSSLLTIDMIESVLVRVREICETHEKMELS